jgi:hypothetical protein
MDRFIELAVDVGGDLGQSQFLLEKIRDEFCPNYLIPNLWTFEYETGGRMHTELPPG